MDMTFSEIQAVCRKVADYFDSSKSQEASQFDIGLHSEMGYELRRAENSTESRPTNPILSEASFEELKDRIDAERAKLIDDEETSERAADHLETMTIADMEAIDRVIELARSFGMLAKEEK